MTERRARGDGGLHWDKSRKRWVATATLGLDGRGKRQVRRAFGRTKTEAVAQLCDFLREQADGLPIDRDGHTVREAVEDWLEYGLGRQAPSTIEKYRILCSKHIIPLLGARKLRDLTTREVEAWLRKLSKSLSTETLRRTHACLNRAVRRAAARDSNA